MSGEAWLLVGFAEGVLGTLVMFTVLSMALPRLEAWARQQTGERDKRLLRIEAAAEELLKEEGEVMESYSEREHALRCALWPDVYGEVKAMKSTIPESILCTAEYQQSIEDSLTLRWDVIIAALERGEWEWDVPECPLCKWHYDHAGDPECPPIDCCCWCVLARPEKNGLCHDYFERWDDAFLRDLPAALYWARKLRALIASYRREVKE
jgi:hypothetical protein